MMTGLLTSRILASAAGAFTSGKDEETQGTPRSAREPDDQLLDRRVRDRAGIAELLSCDPHKERLERHEEVLGRHGEFFSALRRRRLQLTGCLPPAPPPPPPPSAARLPPAGPHARSAAPAGPMAHAVPRTGTTRARGTGSRGSSSGASPRNPWRARRAPDAT